jgi:hypothetical protein
VGDEHYASSNSCLEKHQNLHKFVGTVDHLKSYPTRSARMFAIFPSKTSAANDPWYQDTQNVSQNKRDSKEGVEFSWARKYSVEYYNL